MVFGAVSKTQLKAMAPVNKERIKTTCSADIPEPMITLVVEAFRPNRIAADRANRTPRAGFL